MLKKKKKGSKKQHARDAMMMTFGLNKVKIC